MEAEEGSEGSGSYPGTPRDSNEEINGWGNNGQGPRGPAVGTSSQSSDSYSSDDSDSDSSSQRTSGDYMSPITELSLKNNSNIKRDEVKRRVETEPVKASQPLKENKFKSAYEEVYVYEAENEVEGHTAGGGFGSYLAFDSDQKDSSSPSTPLVSQYVDTEGKKGATDEDSQEVSPPFQAFSPSDKFTISNEDNGFRITLIVRALTAKRRTTTMKIMTAWLPESATSRCPTSIGPTLV